MSRPVLIGTCLLLALAALASANIHRGYEIHACCETVELRRATWWGDGGPTRSRADGGVRFRASGDRGDARAVREVKAAVRELLAADQATTFGVRAPGDLEERIRRVYARDLADDELRVAHRVFDEDGEVTGGSTVVDRFAGVRVEPRDRATVLALGHERWDENGARGRTDATFWWLRLVREAGRWKIAELSSGRPA